MGTRTFRARMLLRADRVGDSTEASFRLPYVEIETVNTDAPTEAKNTAPRFRCAEPFREPNRQRILRPAHVSVFVSEYEKNLDKNFDKELRVCYVID